MDTFNYSKAIKAALTKIQELTAQRDPLGADSPYYYADDFTVGCTYAEGGYKERSFETPSETYNYLVFIWECMQEVEAGTVEFNH